MIAYYTGIICKDTGDITTSILSNSNLFTTLSTNSSDFVNVLLLFQLPPTNLFLYSYIFFIYIKYLIYNKLKILFLYIKKI